MKRANANGADPFCTISSMSNFGTPTNTGYEFATNTTENQSVKISLPTQHYSGYADIICVLNSGDTMFGVRYTRSVWDLGLSVRHIFSMARRNDAE